ncbi:hypothetical protein P7C70_g8779, partial [Phenoliferia sp. Uapishka_3]
MNGFDRGVLLSLLALPFPHTNSPSSLSPSTQSQSSAPPQLSAVAPTSPLPPIPTQPTPRPSANFNLSYPSFERMNHSCTVID